MYRLLIAYSLFFGMILSLAGCMGTMVIGTAGVATQATTDPRTIGHQLDDYTLKVRILRALRQDQVVQKNTRYQLHLHTGIVLLTGQAPTAGLRQQIEQIVASVPGILAIHNEIRILPVISTQCVAHDIWITTKIRSQLLANKKIKFNHVKLAVENREVFLYGSVTPVEAETAVEIARQPQGVHKVVKLFQYLPELRQ
jgi:osmotically-inducible protein OsmY